ncbi:tol-pal system protein YbgF [Malonomonas rubra DSM 5091]|uniref:Tol-pal system protein YbgF n=1 Tax=Malonomonas rubra DSM 5091 TaxID=1122189 RepID=A0A1M6EZ25_MALRU|nr:tol-pal system protein YbgF [Malonomonas rubra]SHI90656.1 tol-pal system protein YbgF [Malonomonas rubra DSM 5091]
MSQSLRSSTLSLTLSALACLFLLNACTATTTAGPSAALKQQFLQIQQEQRQQAQLLANLQQQMAELQQQLLGAPAQPQLGAEESFATTSQSMPQPQTTVVPAEIKQEIAGLADSAASYLAAFSSLAAGRYAVAENGFNNFLNSYPQHQYSANARYWLASAQLSQGKLNLAATNLRQVIVSANGQDRAPGAMLLLAKLYRQQQQTEAADELLEQLRDRFPNSAETQQLAPAITN